jgi:hypothetical protein
VPEQTEATQFLYGVFAISALFFRAEPIFLRALDFPRFPSSCHARISFSKSLLAPEVTFTHGYALTSQHL